MFRVSSAFFVWINRLRRHLGHCHREAFKVFCGLGLFLFWAAVSGPVSSTSITARYIRIELPGEQRVLSLAEVQVYSGEKLVSGRGKAEQSTTFREASADKAIDGETSGTFFEGSVTHTEPGSSVWWELDLGSESEITKLVIYNRKDCCADRINPARIILRNREQNVVWQNDIISTQSRYDIDVSPTTGRPWLKGRNLLRNAAFRQSTNPPLPDYWDLHHAAALEFKDLHTQYGLDTTIPPPIEGVDVLKIVNSEDNFRYVILMPTKIEGDLAAGGYTYSVYLRADRPALISLTKAWASGKEVTKEVGTRWQRYVFTFEHQGGTQGLQPVMYLPKKASYFIAAPQLEKGSIATPFDSGHTTAEEQSFGQAAEKLSALIKSSTRNLMHVERAGKAFQSSMEYDYYTQQDTARLQVSSTFGVDIDAQVTCLDTSAENKTVIIKKVTVLQRRSIYVDLPIKTLRPGVYRCTIAATGRYARTVVSAVDIKKLQPNTVEVRFNHGKRFFAINGVPFSIIGIAVRPGIVPDWYLSDLKDHGFNTLFYSRTPERNGQYDAENLKSVVTAAAKYDLKVVVGLAVAGAKPKDLQSKVASFLSLVEQLKGYPQIIGWYPVDEPSAKTWEDGELINFYTAIKQKDPYRLVFVNWAYDGVPRQVGQQPRGTLDASDIYAIDYYPFTTPTQSLEGFTDTTIRTALTAKIFNKPFFSWLQLFGGNTAWREPTGAELNYMAYVNFIYGGMIGYFDTKSNSALTWEKIKTINRQGKELAEKLFLSDSTLRLLEPTLTKNFLYTVWKKGPIIYLIVLNRNAVANDFSYEISSLAGIALPMSIRSLFEGDVTQTADGRISARLGPYESRVYELKPL